jgi:protein-S-isoprenylcysteine O-methyltransferase Ste14
MNTGYAVAVLGVLGIILGAAMYAIPWHRTIGLGGVGLGVILLLVGVWMARSMKPKAAPPAAEGAQPAKP